ncbi:DUF4097 family beta strand repeat-containing protein [Fulvivirga imtechensis]|nr:DUF4097 family beta strand repeat-containing protein [Fulvivirga imtechensis]
MKTQIKNVLALLILVMASVPGVAQYKVAMSSGILEFKEISHVEVEGYSGSEVIIEPSGEYKIPERAKGLRPVNGLGLSDNTGIGLAVKDEGKDHKVVYQVARNADAKYVVKVPKGVKVRYINSSIHGDDFKAQNITEEMEVQTQGGDIRLVDVTGPVSVSSVHGNIDVIFSSVTQKLPSSIATVHGDVDVTIPASTNADLAISTAWGEVYSDLDIKVDNPEGMKVFGAKKINGKLGAGGTKLTLSATHGNVFLRKK